MRKKERERKSPSKELRIHAHLEIRKGRGNLSRAHKGPRAHAHVRSLSAEHAAWFLRESGFRATPGRIELLCALAASESPASASELAGVIGKNLDEVNVYRALKAFAGRGLARMVQYERERARFEFAEGGHHHHHLICTDCGVVEHIDIPSDASLEREALSASRAFKAVSAHALEFSGTCDKCALN